MSKTAGGLAAVVFLVIAFVAPAVLGDPSVAWLVCLAALTLFAGAVGLAINARPAGLIIDNRNRISLSKLQITAWTLIILSAFVTAVLTRLRLGFEDPVSVVLPGELLTVMGISAASFVTAPMALSTKVHLAPNNAAKNDAAAKIGDKPAEVKSVGLVYARDNTEDAQWLDLFRGDEVGNAGSPDISKVQQFLITVVVLIVYGAAIWQLFRGPEYITDEAGGTAFFSAFPPLSESLVWLIGISHAGYIAYKAAPHGKQK